MKVNAIDSNDKRRSCIVPMAQGALIGGITCLLYTSPSPRD